jgi:hypothetical protein
MASRRATKIDAVLRHLAAGGDIQDFPGTKYENLALARSVERRGLVLWDKEGDRFTLTPAGWSQLTPRRFGLPSMVVSTAVGAGIGAAALAFLWLPGLEGRDSAYGHVTASLALEKPVTPPAAPAVDASGRSVARVPTSTTPTAPTPVSASTTVPAATPAVAVEPAQAAADPAAEQPVAETPPATVKPAAKSHHRTSRHNDRSGNWRAQRYADPRYDMGFPRYSYR